MRLGNLAAARAAFDEAIARLPHHPMAHAALAILGGAGNPLRQGHQADHQPTPSSPPPFEVVMARAAVLVAGDDHAGAVHVVATALAAASSGNTGWLIPIEPLLRVRENRDIWAPVLARLDLRAR